MVAAKDREKTEAIAKKLIKRGKIAEAIDEYKKLISGDEQDIQVRTILGDLYLDLDQKSKAAGEFRKIAGMYEDKGLYSKATAIYKRIIKLKPEDIESVRKLAILLRNQGFNSEAKKEFLSALNKLTSTNKPNEAISIYEEMLKLDPEDIDSRLNLAELYKQQGKKNKSIEAMNEAAERLMNKNQIPQVSDVLQKAKLLDGENPRTLTNLIEFYKRTNKKEEALSLVGTILKKDKNNVKALYLQGNLFYEEDKSEDAENIFSQIISIRPKEIDAKIKLAQIHLKREDYDQAYKFLDPLAETLIRKNKLDKAIGLLGLIIATKKRHILTLERLAGIFDSDNQTENEVLVYRAILNEHRRNGNKVQMFSVLQRLSELAPENKSFVTEMLTLKKDVGVGDGTTFGDTEVETPEMDVIDKEPSVDEPAIEEPVPEEPPVEEPPAEELVIEEPAVEEPVPEEPQPGEIQLEGPGVEEPPVEEPPAEELVIEEPAVEEPVPEEPQPGEIQFEGPDVEEPPAEELVIEEPTVEEPVPEEPQPGEIQFEGPPAEELVIEEPAVEEAPVEEPVPEEFQPEELQVKEPEAEEPQEEELPKDKPSKKDGKKSKEKKHVESKDDDVEALISKADLYVEQGLVRNAKRILENLRLQHPDDERINSKIDELSGKSSKKVNIDEIQGRIVQVAAEETKLVDKELTSEEKVTATMFIEGMDDEKLSAADIFAETDIIPVGAQDSKEKKYYDLTDKIEIELDAIKIIINHQIRGDTTIVEKALSDIVSEFRKALEEKVEKDDYESHYNLGIAFLEQGLYDEAIEECRLAAKDTQFEVEAYSVMSHCYREKKEYKQALKWLDKALHASEPSSIQSFALRYEKASLFEDMKENKKALAEYQEVKNWNSDYRGVSEKVSNLEGA